MTFWGVTEQGERFLLGNASEASITYDDDAPADLLKAKFTADSLWQQLAELEAYQNGELIFYGIVDEQTTSLSSTGLSVELICRSRECILLDNEAEPITIAAPSLEKLEDKLLKPLGLAIGEGDRTAKHGQLAVAKGESVWTVLARFCSEYLGTTPWVDLNGTVQCQNTTESTTVELCNVVSSKIKQLPCKRITEVWQQSTRGNYDTLYKSGTGGITRRRYLSAQSTKSPRQVLADSENEACEISVTCAGEWWHAKNSLVLVSVPKIGRLTGCTVRAIRYKYNKSGEQTTLTLAGGNIQPQ